MLTNNASSPTGNNPKAYLNVIFFDERFSFVGESSQAVRVQTAGNGAAPLAFLNIKVPKNARPTDPSGGVIAWFTLATKAMNRFILMTCRPALSLSKGTPRPGKDYRRKPLLRLQPAPSLKRGLKNCPT